MKKTLVFAFACLALVACTKKNQHPDYFGTVIPKHPADEMWTNVGGEPQYMDPTLVSDSVSFNLTDSMFVRLTEIHPTKIEPVPDLATRWDISEDGTEYTFHLLKDAKWSDGKKLTAHDVEWSWKRLLNPKSVSTYSQMADIIDNGEAYRTQAVSVAHMVKFDHLTTKAFSKLLPKAYQGFKVYKDRPTRKFFVFVSADDVDTASGLRQDLINKINEEGLLGIKPKAAITSAEDVQVRAIDDHTLYVKLRTPAPYFTNMITYIVFAPVPRHVIEKFEAQGNADLWTRAENIVVSGAFKLAKEEFKQFKIFEKNPHFYDAQHVKLNRVKAIMIETAQPIMMAYKTGQHDWSSTDSFPAEFVDEMKKYKDVHFSTKAAVYYYQFNTTQKPFDDVRVRKALSLAVDRQQLTENVLRQGQIPARDLVMDGLNGYESIHSEIFDPIQAKKLLAQAGFPEGKDFPRVTVKYNTSEGHKKIAEAVQEMWRKHLNIQVEIANMEWRSLIEDQRLMKFDILRMAWVADYLDPHTFLSTFLSDSTNNHTGWGSKAYDDLIHASDFEKDLQKRNALFQKAEKIIADEQPIMPFYWYTGSKLIKPYLMGLWPNVKDKYNWKYMWIDERWYDGVPENPDAVENIPWK